MEKHSSMLVETNFRQFYTIILTFVGEISEFTLHVFCLFCMKNALKLCSRYRD